MNLNESENNELRDSLNQTQIINTVESNYTKKNSEILKAINSSSSVKNFLAHILGTLNQYPFLLIIIEIFLGLLFIGLPIYLIIYLNIFDNKIVPFFIILSFSIVFSFAIVILRIIDDRNHNLYSFAKWQRNNIFSNFGLAINLLILILPTFYLFQLYKELHIEIEKHKEYKNLESFFFNHLIFDLYYFTYYNKKNNPNSNIYMNSEKKINNIIQNNLFYSSIFFIIIFLIKIIKLILIQLKFSLEQMIFYLTGFIFCTINILLHIKIFDKKIISLIQFILILLFLFIYDIWIIHNIILKIINKNDKSFGIQNYNKIHLLSIFIFDLLLISGTSNILIGIILYYMQYFNYINNNKEIENIDKIKFFLSLGFILNTLGFCYYYGRHLMKALMKPISYEYIPSELKDKNYIRVYMNIKFFERLRIYSKRKKRKCKKY